MREYEVATQLGYVNIKAEKIIRIKTNDEKPIKIMFQIKDEIIAEYYADHMAGWREIKEVSE